ncbi:SDR family oxidoreductase [Luteolibacter sp. LG18]|uniref:SDR family oxidoreductase n=1 Tax=Luteolibacter sp. LG18 TaxID=2819286 RepID=UPI002B2FE8B0|nr:dioxygenase [Luteolibacter sp. LG18]
MKPLFDLSDRVYVVTGATGALAGSAADYLASQGARVVYLGRSQDKLDAALAKCREKTPDAQCIGLIADVLDRPALEAACEETLRRWGRIDGLVNGAGGNMPGATISPDKTFVDLDFEAFRQVVDLNLNGTVLPSLVFAQALIDSGRGSIVNFSSVSAPQAVTRVVGYSAAKAGVENFTSWLAVDMARRTGGKVRVNAVLPGFFLGDQNRRLLTNEDGSLTERGSLVVNNTPFGRFGQADELHGVIHYLLADASKFVTGTILPVDGGFVAFSGV